MLNTNNTSFKSNIKIKSTVGERCCSYTSIRNIGVKKLDTLNIKDDSITLNLYRILNQYREFFVQELDTDTKKPKDNFYMIKDQPIFKNQPIAPKENLQEYWMNTPLKN